MAANIPNRIFGGIGLGQQSNKGPVLAQNDQNRPQVGQADKAKLLGKKESGIRPAPVNAASRIGPSSSFVANSSSIPSVIGGLRNRTLASTNLLSGSLRLPKEASEKIQQQAPTTKQPSIRPEDWVVVPVARPTAVYNIDTDLESHLMCPSLAPAQYAYLMSIEDKFMTEIGFLSKSKIDSLTRLAIVNWMTTVHRQFAEQQEALFLAVNYFDRFMAVSPAGPSSISSSLTPYQAAQRVAATALYVACKFEEIYAPSIDQICGSTDQPRATPTEIRRIEFDMLRSLRFRVNPPLLNHFLRRCSKAAGATALLHSLGKYLIEISLYDPDLATGTKPSLVAAACSYIAMLVFGERTREWDETMVHYSGGYTEGHVRPVAQKLLQLHRQIAAREGSMLVKAKWDDMIKHHVFAEWVRNATL